MDSDTKVNDKENDISVAVVETRSQSPDARGTGYETTSAVHRRFESYHINLISMGGTIGTSLFIYMGSGLTKGGPANLLLGYLYWSSVIYAVAMCQLEMVSLWPTDAAFSRNAARYIDDAFGFAMGWNFFLSQAALVVFEVVAFGVVLGFWQTTLSVNAGVFIAIVLVAYAALNLWSTRFYGNAEFAASFGKILLIVGLLVFTFITMVGGNPQHKAFGFTYWKNPGSFNSPYPQHGHTTGQFEGFLACIINAVFTIAGPDYLSVLAGEARNPRKTMPKAFRTTVYRLCLFYLGSALCIGILVPFNDPGLLGAIASDKAGAGKSPYVIAMQNMAIPVLPSIVNALVLSSVFSAGNAFVFCGSRTLAQLSRDGQAPKFLGKRNRNGVPWISVAVVLIIGLLSFCQLSSSAVVVITWVTGLVGSAQLVTWIIMALSWIRFNAAMKKQGMSRDTLPARSRLQPYAAWYALVSATFGLLMQGYPTFLKGNWDVSSFLFSYAMPFIFIGLALFWKIVQRTTFRTVSNIDLVSNFEDPDFQDKAYVEEPEKGFSGVAHMALKKIF